MTYDVVDLFSGPGGWCEGFRQTGSPLSVIGIEYDRDACETGKANGHKRLQHDVSKLDPFEFFGAAGLIASPPCQGFSFAGKGAGRKDADLLVSGILALVGRYMPGTVGTGVGDLIDNLRRDMKDPRSVLALEPLRWAAEIVPLWTVWEQVPAVLPIWEACAEVLREIGYSVWVGKLGSEQFGVPQTRTRAILIASRTKEAKAPVPTHSKYYSRAQDRLDRGVEKWVSISDVIDFDNGVVGFPRRSDGREEVVIDGEAYRARDMRDVKYPSQSITEKARSWQFCGAGVTSERTAGQRPRELDQPAHTITGKGTAAWKGLTFDRRVSVPEAAVLQSFPAGYIWTGSKTSQFVQIGNAIPPLLAQRILEAVL